MSLSTRLNQLKSELQELDKQISDLNKQRHELRGEISCLETQLDSSNTLNDSAYLNTKYPWSNEVYRILRQVFKLQEFRSYQLSAINATLSKKDCLLIMPTGGGKSLTFQLPSLLSKGLTVVIAPLISLMEDHLNHLKTLGISSVVLNGSCTSGQSRDIYKGLESTPVPFKIIFVTPEMLHKSKTLMKALQKCHANNQLSRFVIDEVHCLSTWGHDFRQDYQILHEVKYLFPNAPILGLTATATPVVINSIQRELSIMGCPVFKDSFYRANLYYKVENVDDIKPDAVITKMANLIQNDYYGKTGLIYCLTIKDVETVTQSLQNWGISALPYHAQMEAEDRKKSYRQWFNGTINVIVATIAFGMGINKNNVRFVFHYSMSKSLENYYQETGRAGRDGLPSDCILFYRFSDIFRVSKLNADSKSSKETFLAMLKYCVNRVDCKKKLIAEYFGDDWKEDCNMQCDNCRTPIDHREVDVSDDMEMLAKIIEFNNENSKRITFLKMLDVWLGNGDRKCRPDDLVVPNYTREIAQQIIVYFLLDGYLREDHHFTAYATLCYAELGRRWHSKKGALTNLIYLLPMGVSETPWNKNIYKTTKTTDYQPPKKNNTKQKPTTKHNKKETNNSNNSSTSGASTSSSQSSFDTANNLGWAGQTVKNEGNVGNTPNIKAEKKKPKSPKTDSKNCDKKWNPKKIRKDESVECIVLD